MRILQLCSGRERNGAIGHCLDLSRRLAARGHQVVVGHRRGAWLGEQAAQIGLPTLTLEMGRWPFSRLQSELAAIRDGGFDLVHTHQSRAHLFGVISKFCLGIPSIATAHARFFQPHWMLNHHVIAPTRTTADYHRRVNRVSRDRLTVVHNWISDAHRTLPKPAEVAGLREELGIAGDERVLLVVGNVERRKGLDLLVRSLPAILDWHPRTRLVAVGMRSKPFVPEVKRLAKSLGVSEHLLLLGERNDVPRLLGMADLFCLPSREEQLPLAVLEAMSAGLPIVATRVGGLPECIEHRQHGLLVPPEDPTALSTAINELLGDPSLGERLGAAAVARIAAEFRPDHCLTAIESVYQRVLEQERAPTRPRFKPAVILRQLI